jgi:hypothetical protein
MQHMKDITFRTQPLTCLVVMGDRCSQTDTGASSPGGADRMGSNVHDRAQHLGLGHTRVTDLK